MANYLDDDRWSRRFAPEIKDICGRCLHIDPRRILDASYEEDVHHNTDLVIVGDDPKRVGYRVRQHRYLQQYPNDFTIRNSRPNGVPSELEKVLDGWGDYLFYGFSDHDEHHLAAWVLGDLGVFREWYQSWCEQFGKPPGTVLPNGDGSSTLRAFWIKDLWPQFIIARQYDTPLGF